MIGFNAEAAYTNINMDTEEMTDVKWFTREEVLLALEGNSEQLRVPMKIAIAHHLLKDWAYNNIQSTFVGGGVDKTQKKQQTIGTISKYIIA